MIKESITLDEVIEALNSMLACDNKAIQSMVMDRVRCNEALADHPSAQVAGDSGYYSIGLLGVINGLFGVDEWGRGPIALVAIDNTIMFFTRDKK